VAIWRGGKEVFLVLGPGPDKNESRERFGWVPVDVSAPFKAADINIDIN